MSSTSAIIQEIEKETLKIAIGGEVRQIKLELEELKKLLLAHQVTTIQKADKIYNIESIDTANFGMFTDKKAFNEYLIPTLIEAITTYSKPAAAFLKKASIYENWESQERISDRAKAILAYSLVGEIGKQLRKLFAIGKEPFSDGKQRKYIQKSIHIAKYTLDLLNFTLISRLWEIQTASPPSLSDTLTDEIIDQLRAPFPLTLTDRFELLQNLFKKYQLHKLSFPIDELTGLEDQLTPSSELENCISQIQALNDNLDKEKYDILDCAEVEKQLATFLSAFTFLVNYNMVSIKSIGYWEIRNSEPVYLHRFTALGVDSKANVDAERIIGIANTVNTDAVLFYKGQDYTNNINLYPFVIDYNTLTNETGAKICFFQCLASDDVSLEYIFLDDSDTIIIGKSGTSVQEVNFEELMKNGEQRKKFNLDCVVNGYESALEELLSHTQA